MLKKGQNLPVRGLYEIGISMFFEPAELENEA